MKRLLILSMAVVLLLQVLRSSSTPVIEASAQISSTGGQSAHSADVLEVLPQGFGPFAIAITENGEYAYIGFDLSEVVFKVRLEDLEIEGVADLHEYFPLQNENMALDVSEEKLFIYSPTWQKLLVLDTQTMEVIHTIDDIIAADIIRSRYGPFLLAPAGAPWVSLVNTETYEVTTLTDYQTYFERIQESPVEEGRWYVVSTDAPGGFSVRNYDYETMTWDFSVFVPYQDENENIFDFEILPNQQKAYVATFSGWTPEGQGHGWLYSINLVGGEVSAIPVDGGALCIEASPDSGWLYVGTGWPDHQYYHNLLEVDTQSDSIARRVSWGKTEDGYYHTQMNDLQISPVHPDLLYATGGDTNALLKVELDSLTIADMRIMNKESFRPRLFVEHPGRNSGYVLIYESANAFELDLDEAIIENVVEFPLIRDDAFTYDGVINDSGRLLMAQGEAIIEIDPEDMRLLETHPLPPGITIWNFILSNDQTRIYSIADDEPSTPELDPHLLAIDTAHFQLEASISLGEDLSFDLPYELPGGQKLYVLGGFHKGRVVVQVIDTEDYTIQKSLTFDQPGLLGIGAGYANFYPYAYDAGSRTLFGGATHVVLAVDTDLDEIEQVIDLREVAPAIGLTNPSWLTHDNAVGLSYSPVEDYLYIAHFDRGFVSIYDLENDQFLPQAIPLKGINPRYVFANGDYSKIYSLMGRSDSISVINVDSKAVEKVIDLHEYLSDGYTLFLPVVLK